MREKNWRSKGHAKVLRRDATEAERRLWTRLRRKQISDAKFRRQHPIDNYVADFACIARKVVVEVDGATHSTTGEIAYDKKRTSHFEKQGWTVLRVTNFDVFNALDDVVDFIARSLPPPSLRDTSPVNGGGDTSQEEIETPPDTGWQP